MTWAPTTETARLTTGLASLAAQALTATSFGARRRAAITHALGRPSRSRRRNLVGVGLRTLGCFYLLRVKLTKYLLRTTYLLSLTTSHLLTYSAIDDARVQCGDAGGGKLNIVS